MSDEENFSRIWNLIQQDIATNPASTSRGGGEWLTLLNYFPHEEMFGDNKKISDAELFEIVFEKEQVRIVAGSEPFAHRTECAVGHSVPKFCLLAFEFVFFLARRTKEICHGLVWRKCTDLRTSAIWAKHLIANPAFGPRPRALRPACIWSLNFFEAQPHWANLNERL
jgi:hypothetical protein